MKWLCGIILGAGILAGLSALTSGASERHKAVLAMLNAEGFEGRVRLTDFAPCWRANILGVRFQIENSATQAAHWGVVCWDRATQKWEFADLRRM